MHCLVPFDKHRRTFHNIRQRYWRLSKAKSWIEVMWKNNAFEHEFFFHVFVVQKIIFFLFCHFRHWKFWDSSNLLLWISVVLTFCRLTIYDNRMSYWFYDHKLKEMKNNWFIPMLTYHSMLTVDWGERKNWGNNI